jgi:multicomponent Na+:H+ antiporter subunit C
MDTFLFYAVLSVVLFCIGLHGLVTRPHLLRKLIALNIVGIAVFLFLIAVAYRNAAPEPDALPHAMVLTGIVVKVCATAFALALARRIEALTGRLALPGDEGGEA